MFPADPLSTGRQRREGRRQGRGRRPALPDRGPAPPGPAWTTEPACPGPDPARHRGPIRSGRHRTKVSFLGRHLGLTQGCTLASALLGRSFVPWGWTASLSGDGGGGVHVGTRGEQGGGDLKWARSLWDCEVAFPARAPSGRPASWRDPPASLLSSLFNNGAAARGQAAPGLPRAPVSLHVHEAATRAGRGGHKAKASPCVPFGQKSPLPGTSLHSSVRKG